MLDFIQSSWGLEAWLQEAWALINDDERREVQNRVDALFADGFPLQLKHDKIVYAYIFSMLSQLEVVAVQVPLKFLQKLEDPLLNALMRQQLVDEIFHTVVFSKIAHEMSYPYAFPPEFNDGIQKICSIVSDENDICSTIILLNLVAEGWIEQIFDLLSDHQVSPKIFETILEDERRHVEEGELYSALGARDDMSYLKEKLATLEDDMISHVLFQRKYLNAMIQVVGTQGCLTLLKNIDKKHRSQLAKIGLKPSDKWDIFIEQFPNFVKGYAYDYNQDKQIPLSPTRKFLMRYFTHPENPTMFSMFNLDVTALDYFKNKYPIQTITGLVLQAISKMCKENPVLRRYISHNKLYQSEINQVHLVVNLPGENNHIAMIRLQDCHEMSLYELSEHIRHDIELINYCHYKAEMLEETYPELAEAFDSFYLPNPDDWFQDVRVPYPIISLSNVAPWGHEQAISPLIPYETMKFTLAKVKREQVWNTRSESFEIKDNLPVGLSVDHRVMDASASSPKLFQIAFDEMFYKMLDSDAEASPKVAYTDVDAFIEQAEELIEINPKMAYKILKMCSQVWVSGGQKVSNSIDEKIGELALFEE